MNEENVASLKAEEAFWINPNNYKHFNRAYWERELKKDNLDFSFFKDKIICEIGCGPFGMIFYATEAKERIGVDPLIDFYRTIGLLPLQKTKDIILISAPAENLTELDSDSVDIAICYNVLDHVTKPNQVLSEIRRILKENGELYFNCHAVGRLLSPVRKMLKIFDPPHPHHFSKKDIESLLQQSGFRIIHNQWYRMTPSLTSLKAIVGRITMFHYSCLVKSAKG